MKYSNKASFFVTVVRARTACHFVHQLHHAIGASRHQRSWEAKEDVVRMYQKWYDYMQPGWCQPIRQEFMENECEALPGVAYPRVRDNRSTVNTKTGYDDDDLSSHRPKHIMSWTVVKYSVDEPFYIWCRVDVERRHSQNNTKCNGLCWHILYCASMNHRIFNISSTVDLITSYCWWIYI